MANSLMIIVCILLLLAYVFDLTASKTKVPAVILLLILGFTVGRFTELFGFDIPDLNPLLPVFGTIGLILIVLEGSLELEFNRSKSVLIKKSLLAAAIPMFLMAFLLTYLFQYYGDVSFRDGLLNAIPLCVISSAIAIPSVKGLPSFNKEFVIYESSLSDIIGVLFFNFIALNEVIGLHSFGHFGLQILLITLISFIATIGLAFLLNKIDHHIKFVPIILLVILIYGVSKEYHLPGLIFILFFGLFLGIWMS
jgi:cell volume regulation protein A